MFFILINNHSRLETYNKAGQFVPGPVVSVPGPQFAAAVRYKGLDKTQANIYLLVYFLSLGP
jgi:hypothetical protein